MGEFKLASFITLIIALSVGILSLIPNHLQASEEKPEAIVVPVAILGEVSEIRRKILQNTLNEIWTQKIKPVIEIDALNFSFYQIIKIKA